jgi:hypothetical protein
MEQPKQDAGPEPEIMGGPGRRPLSAPVSVPATVVATGALTVGGTTVTTASVIPFAPAVLPAAAGPFWSIAAGLAGVWFMTRPANSY